MRTSGVSLVVLVSALAGTALAQPAAGDKTGKQKRADELFEEGRKLLSEGDQNAAAACAKFDEAIKLDPEAPGTMLNLGLCNEKLSKYHTALVWFRKAQNRASETNLPEYENAAKQHTVDLAGKVATIKIGFATSAPDGTKVRIDNQEIAPSDYLAAEVDPGDHTLVAGAPGYKIFTQQFTVVGRGGQTINVDLVQGDNSVVVDPGAGRRKAAIITAIGGGGLLVGSLIVSLYAKSQYKKCADNGSLKTRSVMDGTMTIIEPVASCPVQGDLSNPDVYNRDKDHANNYQRMALYWGTGLFIAGAAAISVGAILYFTAPDKERVDRTVFVPSVGPDQIGFAATGSF